MRPAAAGAVLGLALAIGAPTAWSLTRPTAAAGAPVVEVLSRPRRPRPRRTRAGGDTRDAPPAAAGAARRRPSGSQVPALGVDSVVDPVGVAADGQMALPDDVDRVGWYRFGPAPGADGLGGARRPRRRPRAGPRRAVPLRDAGVGDEVLVTDADGTTTRWRVVSRELITKQALPLDQLFPRTGPPRLTLITCGGPFLPEYRSYRDNVVVVAEPVR